MQEQRVFTGHQEQCVFRVHMLKPVLPQEYSIAVPGASICRNLLVFKVCSVPGRRELILWFSFYHRLFTCLCYDFDIRKGNSGIFHRSL